MTAPRPLPAETGAAPDPLLRPLALGDLALERRLFMAPMAGLTTPAMRRSVRRWGAGLVYTEMISAYGVHYDNRRTLDYFAYGEEEHPLGFQLFGADADVLAGAAGRAVAAGADLVDLNMACPVRKVVKTGAGAALLAEPVRAAGIVAAVVKAVEDAAPGRGVPVTVKIRAGLRDGDELGRLAAPRLVAAGAAALCIHPRTAAQLYKGHADHAVTFALAAELPAPVIASGDVDGPGGGAAAAGRRRRGGDAGARRRGRAVAVRAGAGRGRAGPRREARRGAPLRGGGHRRAGRPRRRPPAPVLAQVPAPRRLRQALLPGAHAGAGRGRDRHAARPLIAPPGAVAAALVEHASTAISLRLRSGRACPILARHFGTRPQTGPRCRVKEEESVVDREIILTPEGFQRLKEEVEYLSSVKRDEVAERIRAARDFGDISENSEYDDAKNEQAMLEARIFSLEERLRSAIVIDSDSISTEVVGVGTKVTLQDMQRGDVVQYAIVGSAEADPGAHKLSNESPVGRAILGHKPGDKVTVAVPQGSKKFKVLDIEKA